MPTGRGAATGHTTANSDIASASAISAASDSPVSGNRTASSSPMRKIVFTVPAVGTRRSGIRPNSGNRRAIRRPAVSSVSASSPSCIR